MGKLFMIVGRSSSGKDTIVNCLVGDMECEKLIYYTTRPMRDGEEDGVQYYFRDEDALNKAISENRVIEHRTYTVANGEQWHYWTEYDEQFNKKVLVCTGTLEMLKSYREKLTDVSVIPIYIHVDDFILIKRAIEREGENSKPNVVELCRRFIADSEDFSEDKINSANIIYRVSNNFYINHTMDVIKEIVHKEMSLFYKGENRVSDIMLALSEMSVRRA